MWDISWLLEQWACAKAKGNRNVTALITMQKECSSIINGTLSIYSIHSSSALNWRYLTEMVSQAKIALMNYVNYDRKVINRYQMKLVGWTYHEFKSPFDIHTVDDVCTLLEALQCGRCHWVRMTKGDMGHHRDEVDKRIAAGETVGKARQPRSDKGVKRPQKKAPGTSEGASEKDNGAPPAKKQKMVKAIPKLPTTAAKKASKKHQIPSTRPISNEFIDSDSDADVEAT